VTTDANSPTNVGVTALKGGGFVVAYSEFAAGNRDVYAAIYDNSGNQLKAPFKLNDNTDGNQTQPAVAALADGGFVAVWSDRDLDQIMGQRYTAAGDKIGDQFPASSHGSEFGPVITVLDDGRFFVGFEREVGDIDISGSIFDPRDKKVTGTNGDDVLTAFAEGGKVKGLGGDDTLLGAEADGTLIGGKGKDWLAGGMSNDLLKGGKGKDCFVFHSDLDKKTNVDTIKDFGKGKDKLYLLDDFVI
jgi:Ca2+-binding RTX toxin-like protein